MARRAKVKRAVSRAGGFLGIKSLTDLLRVVVTSAGSNYFANVGATATGVGNSQYVRPLLSGLIAYLIAPKSQRNASVIGSVVIALSQAGIIGSLGGLGKIMGGGTNPARGQSSINQLNILGRLP
tara:strand:- start:390 stop:764 length:375 start_codon:yes stop_codon:yes gene_type:complete